MVINFDSSNCNFPKLLFSKACKTANIFVNLKSFKIVVARAEFHARIYGQKYPNLNSEFLLGGSQFFKNV